MKEHCFDEGMDWRNFAPEGVDSQALSLLSCLRALFFAAQWSDPLGHHQQHRPDDRPGWRDHDRGRWDEGAEDAREAPAGAEQQQAGASWGSKLSQKALEELSAEQKEANNIKHFTEKAGGANYF